jgi:hypothetical protein
VRVRRPASFLLTLVLGATLFPARALAAENVPALDGGGLPRPVSPPERREPPVEIALVAGALTSLVPMILGVLHTAGQSPEADGPRNVGLVVSGVGPALAPVVAHVVLGEYRRAALFGSVPVAAEVGVAAYLAAMPGAVFHGTEASRFGFAALYTADLLGAALGMVDVMMARERAHLERRRGPDLLGQFTVAPRLGPGQVAIVLGGVL